MADEIRAYEVLPDGSILYACATRNQFGSKVYLYQAGEGSKLLSEVPYLIDEIVADEERIIVSARAKRASNDLYHFALATGELTPFVETAYAEYGITLAEGLLFYQANYEQAYAVYCYDFNSKEIYRMTTGGYAAQPAYDSATEELYFIGLNSFGFDLYRKKARFEESFS